MFCHVLKIFKDINYSSFIGLLLYENGLFSTILISDGLSFGDYLFSGIPFVSKNFYSNGSALPLNYIMFLLC